MPNYSEGKIYAIRSHQTDRVYVGSTTQPLAKRFYEHKTAYQAYINNQKIYVSSFEMFKYDDCYIELIRKYPCESREELAREEGKTIREMNCVNKKIAGRTLKEYFEDNREEFNERMKEYYKDPEKREMQKKSTSEVIICNTCNCEMIKNSWLKHFKSIKHRSVVPLHHGSVVPLHHVSDTDKTGVQQPAAGWRPKIIRTKPVKNRVTYSNEECFHCIFCDEVKKNVTKRLIDLKSGSTEIQIEICEGCQDRNTDL